MKKKDLSGIFLVLIFFIGLCVLLYPSVSEYLNSRAQSKAIVNYEETVSGMNEEDFDKLFNEADDYNRQLNNLDFPLVQYHTVPNYNEILNVNKNGIIGYITIDKIKVELPIYHGTSPEVLNIAAGHLEGSSMPVGGESTHSIISAHRGLPSAKLFTNLDRLEIGDTFQITVLDRVITYSIDQILIVDPKDSEELQTKEGEDYCTLLTCTPYGINTHRLLVRGTRIENLKDKPIVYVTSEAFKIDPLIITPVVSAPILLILLVYMLVKYRKKNASGNDVKGGGNSEKIQ